MNLIDLFIRAITGARPADVKRPSRRKPTHGHRTRQARRLLARPNLQPVPPRRYGDPATTGRSETASARRRRRALEQRCRAGGHAVRMVHDAKWGAIPAGCRCGEVGP